MSIDKKVANKVLSNLDRTASLLEDLAKEGKVDQRLASKLVLEIDSFADRFQVAAFGEENFRKFQAKVLQRDSDEKYMDTFNAPTKVHQKGADDKVMDAFEDDQSMAVVDRDEHKIRELSSHADGTKKQPSWARGPVASSTNRSKTWAD